MKPKLYRSTFSKHPARSLVLVFALLIFSAPAVLAQSGQDPQPTPTPIAQPTSAPIAQAEDAPKIPNDQLDSLVAPIALYPDPLLSQVLVASTYPLELIQLQQWLAKTGSYMNEKAVAEGVQKQDWDPSIQAMALLPNVVKQLADNVKWTTDLGNAFLAQQSDVMDAVQRMRTKAKDGGKLQSSEQIKVETKEVENKTVVVIEQANPEVVYVPSYNPAVIWGAMYYPYPYMYYPPYGYYGGAYIGYAAGIAIGVAWAGGWGWGTGWGNNNININRNNNFVSNYNNTRGSGINSGNNTWRHNAQHRGGAPYSNRSVANQYGGSARGDSMGMRQSIARQNPGQFGAGRAQAGTMDRTGLGGGSRDFSSMGGSRGSFGGDGIGSRNVSGGMGSQRSAGSFGGNGSWGGGAARASSSRGSSSMGGGYSRGGGGFSRGGGGMRGGGGRR